MSTPSGHPDTTHRRTERTSGGFQHLWSNIGACSVSPAKPTNRKDAAFRLRCSDSRIGQGSTDKSSLVTAAPFCPGRAPSVDGRTFSIIADRRRSALSSNLARDSSTDQFKPSSVARHDIADTFALSHSRSDPLSLSSRRGRALRIGGGTPRRTARQSDGMRCGMAWPCKEGHSWEH